MTSPALVDEDARELMAVQIMSFVMALKSFVRTEPIELEEIGERMNSDVIDELNESVCPPMIALRNITQTGGPPAVASSPLSRI